MIKYFRFCSIVLILLVAVSCSKKPQFTVEGRITDADSSVLYLEKRELNKIVMLDSVKLADTKGEFKFKEEATPYPEFYVLRLNGQVINFAIDSTENLVVNAPKKTFSTDYSLSGDAANSNLLLKDAVLAQYKANGALLDLQNKFNSKTINEQAYISQAQLIVNEYKDSAKKVIFTDLKGPAAYFALFQKVGDYLYFDPYDKSDYKVFAAVATSWDLFRKDSPRSKQLRDYTLTAMSVRKQNEQQSQALDSTKVGVVEAAEYYNIELPDVNGKLTSLRSLKGKPVILDFTVYQDENSPRHNIELNNIYSKHRPNVEIYQVAFDGDAHLWKNAAVNIPWTAVHESKSVNSDLIFKYNLQNLPTVFLLDREGNIVKRLRPGDNIELEIQKIL